MAEVEHSKHLNNRFILDSSVIISGKIIELIDSGKIYDLGGLNKDDEIEIILSRIVIAELENKANQDKTSGLIGVEMLKKLKRSAEDEFLSSGKKISVNTYGDRPSLEQIKLNSGGELDAAIRQHALEMKATLITSDRIQADLAEIEKIPLIYIEIEPQSNRIGTKIQDFFDEHSMSVHLRSNCIPQAKKGSPGNWKLKQIGDKIITKNEIIELESQIISDAESDPESFIEKDLKGVTVVQLQNYRIVICRPPFSDLHEITAVKPLVKLSLDDYNVTSEISKRLVDAEGVLVAGIPGAGKSTFISALAEFYLRKNKVIKTLESVRDLQVPPEISQYTDLEDDFEKTADILLLLRPDYTIFDEIRTSNDFKIFTDMRLAGVGMIGVIHASSALDAIQRFIRRIELGVIPSVLDTVIFIQNGIISEILKIHIVVKVPKGFRDQGLARPVIEVRDFYNSRLIYEIYEFGSNIVVMPVEQDNSDSYYSTQRYDKKPEYQKQKKKKQANKRGRSRSFEYRNDGYDYKTSIDNDNDDNYNFTDSIQSLEPEQNSEDVKFTIMYGKKFLILKAGSEYSGSYIDLFANDDFIASTTMNKNGEIHLTKDTNIFKKIDQAIQEEKEIIGRLGY